MPIVVNPSFVWPPDTDPVVSPDGKITAIVDPAHAGVLLRADFDDSVPDIPAQPEKVLRRNTVLAPRGVPGGSESNWTQGGGAPGASYVSDYGQPFSQSVIPSVTTCRTITIVNAAGVPNLYTRPAVTWTPVNPGEYVNTGMIVQWPKAVRVVVFVQFYDANKTYISASPQSGVDVTPGQAAWLSTSVQAPSNAAFFFALFGQASNTLIANGDVWRFSAAIAVTEPVSRTLMAKDFFDGNSSSAGTKRYRYATDGASEEYTPETPFIPGKPGTVARVRFERQDGSLVRSGNPAWAPGGYAHAYDHEATLGGGTLWRAVPIRFDGTEGTPSEYVGAVIPALSDGWAWLKPVADPNKAMLLKVEPPDLSYDGRVDTTSIAGSARPAATWDVLEGFTTQLRSLVREKPVADQLMALLDEGPVLAQFPACAGLPDFYFIRGKVDLEHVHWDGYPWRRYQWDVISIDRPDTTDSPLRIPDLSYDTVERDWTTYDQLKSTVVSYNKLLEP